MKIFLILGACLFFWAHNAIAQSAQTYFRALPDIPAAPGLMEIDGQGVSFEKPEGRIAETAAIIRSGSADATMRFYEAALPPLGWIPASAGVFRRDQETLTLRAEYTGNASIMRFQVRPTH